jgi:hypothetical protein
MNRPISWRAIYATYRFCGHGRLWSAWRGLCYVRGNADPLARVPQDPVFMTKRTAFLKQLHH